MYAGISFYGITARRRNQWASISVATSSLLMDAG